MEFIAIAFIIFGAFIMIIAHDRNRRGAILYVAAGLLISVGFMLLWTSFSESGIQAARHLKAML